MGHLIKFPCKSGILRGAPASGRPFPPFGQHNSPMPQRTYLRRPGQVLFTDPRPRFVNGAGVPLLFPYQKGAPVKVTAALRGDEMIAGPNRMVMLYDVKDVLTPLAFPSLDIAVCGKGENIGEAAFAAPEALNCPGFHFFAILDRSRRFFK